MGLNPNPHISTQELLKSHLLHSSPHRLSSHIPLFKSDGNQSSYATSVLWYLGLGITLAYAQCLWVCIVSASGPRSLSIVEDTYRAKFILAYCRRRSPWVTMSFSYIIHVPSYPACNTYQLSSTNKSASYNLMSICRPSSISIFVPYNVNINVNLFI